MKTKRLLLFCLMYLSIATVVLALTYGKNPKFIVKPSLGIWKRNSSGTYDRWIIWPLGRYPNTVPKS